MNPDNRNPEYDESGQGYVDAVAGAPKTPENDPFVVGRERIASAGEFINNARDNVSAAASFVGEKVSRLWTRTKEIGGNAAAAVLSIDDLAAQGSVALGNAVERRVDGAAEWVGSKVEQARGFFASKWEKIVDFKNKRVEQMKNFVKGKIELGKDLAVLTADQTVEGVKKVRDGIANRYNGIKEYGADAVAWAQFQGARLKNAYHERLNAAKVRRLQAEMEKASAERQEALSNSAGWMQNAEQARHRMELLAQKISLLERVKASGTTSAESSKSAAAA